MNPWRAKPLRSKLRRVTSILTVIGMIIGGAVFTAPAHASDYTSSNVPDWAIGPFTRQSQPNPSPVLSPASSGFDTSFVLNPGVVYRNGQFDMLYRGEGNQGVQVGLATSTDGLNFTRSASNPVIKGTVLPQESGGVYDPRLYEMNGTYYAFVEGYNWSVSPPQTILETTSTDLVHWTTQVPIESSNYDPAVVTDGNDTPVLLNTQYGPRYVMYYGDSDPAKGRFIAYSTDMLHWTNSTPFNMQFPNNYNPWEISVAVTNYQTVAGGPVNNNVDLFVAGTLMANGRWYYGISQVEFSSTNLTQQLGQLTEASLSPATSYEINGRTKNTTFMNGILFHNNQWYMYYGAADNVIALATAPLRSSAQTPFTSTSFETGQRYPDWADVVDNGGGQSGGISNVGAYPGSGESGPQADMRIETAHTGSSSLLYAGNASGGSSDYAYMQVFDTSAHPNVFTSSSTLSYWIYPTNTNSECAGLDMIFSDGTALRNLGATDQHGNKLSPSGQCGHLTPNTWNQVTSAIGAVAAGKTLERIDVGYDQPGGSGGYEGYIDDISLNGASTGPTEAPYGGTAAPIPGTVQAADYDTGGSGLAYSVASVNGSNNSYRSDGVDLETCTDTGCGDDIGWTGSGQWFKYTVNVATAGTYTVSLRLSAPSAVTDGLHIANSSGTNLSGNINVPATGGWQTWSTVTADVTLPAGQQTLTIDQDNGGWNIHQLTFASNGATTGINTSAWYEVVNTNSGLCASAAGGSTANGTAVQQLACTGATSQLWQFVPTSVSGEYEVLNENGLSASEAWNITGGDSATANQVPLQIWNYGGTGNTNELFAATQQSNGSWSFVADNSGLCIDTPASSTSSGVQLQQYTCNGTAAQAFNLVQR